MISASSVAGRVSSAIAKAMRLSFEFVGDQSSKRVADTIAALLNWELMVAANRFGCKQPRWRVGLDLENVIMAAIKKILCPTDLSDECSTGSTMTS